MLRTLLAMICVLPVAGLAADGEEAPLTGRPVAEVIDEYRDAGVPFAYSTNLVSGDLLVTGEPQSSDPVDIVREILRPHGLTLRSEAGVHLVVRIPGQRSAEDQTSTETQPLAEAEIEAIVISASRYEILSELAASRFVIDQRTIQNMPDIGQDPMRVVQRLPGAAASGASAKTHFRGGEHDEIGIMLNGHGLFDPFHIRDYQSVFSAIDSRAIEGVEVFTGGFPVRFGDLMSGLVLMESLESVEPRHTEVGISVFNTSFLTAGNEDDRNWVVSARRGNLDLVINSEYGSPSYYDVFGEFSVDLTSDVTLSFNALIADDSVEVILETDPAELEWVRSRTRNAQLWMQLDNRWSDELSSKLVLSGIIFDNRRKGSLGDAEKIVATVLDDREVEQFSFRQDWMFNSSESHLMQWGIEAMYSRAHYDYANSAEYFGLPAMYEDQPESSSRAATADPRGSSYSLYFSDRWRVSDKTVLEWGLRWDDQTYIDGISSDSQLSPRFNLMRTVGDKTELRLSWGRYHQSQGIHTLQIEDGITNFWPAQRADHAIVGLRHLFGDDIALRVELFEKQMHQVRPRFENLFDPLSLIPEVQPDRVRLDPTSARSQGLEITVDRSNGPYTWWASYTLSEVTDRIDGRNEYRSWHQRHAFQGGMSWSGDKWDVALAASVHSGWPTTELYLVEDGVDEDGEPEFVAIPGPRNDSRLGTFASLDFRISRTWQLQRGTFMAFLEISNLTNRRNECCLDWDFEEDEATGEDVFERGVDYWMPLLPAIGVLWEF
ncbi:MAG: TonB-dependent receptor [Woeseiaceae bacterium]|nr:TonB-dependent receptor [Woeseiaceae bacterium]NIP21796.1 TonB-dependent receptor [Woeseiaceae bacterium]NIS90881.1 TonB-dependent receptor [Woeseiaceae bacterium]